MKAFLDSPEIQQKYITRLQQHYDADEIIHGTYWENGKGCAVGCVLHSSNHKQAENELGIPEWIMHLMDTIFEGMPNKNSKEFPLKLFRSIPRGFDNWQHIYHQLCVFMLEKVCKNIDNKIVVKAICDIITLHKTESKDRSAWSAARSAAWSAARSAAWSAAESTAWSAARSTARSTAESAAESAAWSAARSTAESTAESAAESAAWSAARSAAWSAAWSAARSAARSAAYKSIADKFIVLLETEK